MQTIRGKNSPTTNSEQISYSPQSGFNSRWTIEGPKESIRPLINTLASLGFQLTYTCDASPKANIVYETPGATSPSGDGTETPTIVWEYFANEGQIDVLEADLDGTNGTGNLNAIVKANKDQLRSYLNGQELADGGFGVPFTGDTLSLQHLITAGVRNFTISVPTLKVSRLVSGSYAVKASLTNVGRLLSTSTLETQEGIPSTILFNLPSSSTVTKYSETFYYSWLKAHPNVQQVAGNKWQISQQWVFGLWAKLLYGTML